MSISRRILKRIDSLLLSEKGTIYKDWGGKVSVALVFPNSYHIGMSNLGFQGIYGLLNSRDDVVCERAFLPNPDEINEYHRTGSKLCSFESKRPLDRFDIIGFSLSFENDYPNIVKILNLSGITIRASQRYYHRPVLIAGGPCCSINPEPIAEIFDFIFIGEAEETLPVFIDLFKECIPITKDSFSSLQRKVLHLEGLYVPDLYEVYYTDNGGAVRISKDPKAPLNIKRSYFREFSTKQILQCRISTPNTEFANMQLLEVMRGCHWRCRFCVVNAIYHPPRIRDKSTLSHAINHTTDYSTSIGLIAPSISDVPYLTELLNNQKVRLSITSLRASEKSHKLIDLLGENWSISIAPEVGTDRMRRVINKKLTDKEVLQTAERVFQSGIETLRLYFMIGLPFETPEDIDGIIRLVGLIRSLDEKTRLSLTISIFVPKPFTTFQWYGLEDPKKAGLKLKHIKGSLEELKNVEVKTDSPRLALLQATLSRGGRELLDKIIESAEKDDIGIITKDQRIKKKICSNWDLNTPLSWEFIESFSEKTALWEDYINASKHL